MKKLRLKETERGHLASRWWGWHLNPTLFTSLCRFLLSPLQGELGRPIQLVNLVKLDLLGREAGICLANLWNLIWIIWNFALRATEDTPI